MVNHGLAAELATDPLLLRSLSGLFLYRKFTSLSSAGVRALASTSFPGFSPFVQVISEIYKKALKVQILNEVALIQVLRKRVSFQDRKNESTPKFPSIKI